MNCRLHQRLYRLLPLTTWQSFWMKRHLSGCPVCSRELDIGDDLARLAGLTIKPEHVSPAIDLWGDIRRTLASQSRRAAGQLRLSLQRFLLIFLFLLMMLFVFLVFFYYAEKGRAPDMGVLMLVCALLGVLFVSLWVLWFVSRKR